MQLSCNKKTNWKPKCLQESSQHSRTQRPWAHTPLLRSTWKSQLFAEPLMKKTKAYQKRSSTTKDTKKQRNEICRRGKVMVWLRSMPLSEQFANRRLPLQRFSPRRKGSEPRIRLLSPVILHQEIRFKNVWLWSLVGLKFRGIGGLWKTDCNPEGCMQNLTCSRIQGKSSHLKRPWDRPNCWSWEVSQRYKRQLELILRTHTLGAAIFRGSFYQEDTGAGKYHCGIFPLAC